MRQAVSEEYTYNDAPAFGQFGTRPMLPDFTRDRFANVPAAGRLARGDLDRARRLIGQRSPRLDPRTDIRDNGGTTGAGLVFERQMDRREIMAAYVARRLVHAERKRPLSLDGRQVDILEVQNDGVLRQRILWGRSANCGRDCKDGESRQDRFQHNHHLLHRSKIVLRRSSTTLVQRALRDKRCTSRATIPEYTVSGIDREKRQRDDRVGTAARIMSRSNRREGSFSEERNFALIANTIKRRYTVVFDHDDV